MAGFARVDLEWFGDLFKQGVDLRIQQEMHRIGREVVASAKIFAPYKTGELRKSIHYDYNTADYTLTFVVDAPYGIFQEYGTRYMKPNPYLRPAMNMQKIFGFNLEMAFANTPSIRNPLRAIGATFDIPEGLTAKQKAHVKKYLIPRSEAHFISNVSRAKMFLRSYNQ